MKTRYSGSLLFIGILLLFYSCHSDEGDSYPYDGSFFHYTGDDSNLKQFISRLILKSDSTDFVPYFVKEYGTPQWDYSFDFPFQNRHVYAVPVKQGDIGSIWFFDMSEKGTDYFVFPRTEANGIPELTWMFDYFNVELSLYRPAYPGEKLKFVKQITPVEHTDPATRTIVVETRHCNDIYTGTEGNLVYQYTYCWSTYTFIHDEMSKTGLEGGFFDLPGGGGSPGVPKIPPLTPYPLSKSVIKTNVNLTEIELERLEIALDNLMGSCVGEALYNYMVNNNYSFSSVQINSALGGETGYTFGSGRLSFRDGSFIDSGAIFHEMFHLFQESQGSYKGAGYIGLMEYERSLLDDIAFTVENMVDGKIPSDAYINKKSPFITGGTHVPISKDREYRAWLLEVTSNGSSFPLSVNANDLRTWGDVFNLYFRAYQGQCDFSLTYQYDALEKAFELIKNNCGK